MAGFTNKELKELWNGKTVGELRGIYEEYLRIINLSNDSLKENAQKLIDLNIEDSKYATKVKNIVSDINFYKSEIMNNDKDLKILKPILDEKEKKGIDETEYQNYIKNNVNLKVLFEAVNKDKDEFIKSGCITYIQVKNKTVKIVLTEQQVNDMYDLMLRELIWMLKDRIGNIKEVEYLNSNGHKGMDGLFIGDKGEAHINTILAGGYNIQKLHYRTLIYWK